jgi:hypothetical protein
MLNEFNAGDWVDYKGNFAYVHGATKGDRHLIEVQSSQNNVVYREWVKPSSITKLDQAICDLLSSIFNY